MGNRELNELYETFFKDVYHYLLFFTNSQNDAEDLTQETFIKVFKNYEKFQQKSSIKTWIFSIAKNVAIDHFRKKKTIPILPDFFARMNIVDKERTEEKLDKREEWEQLQHALLKLKPPYRNVIILRGLKEMSTRDTAEILEWTETKVKVTFFRALKEMKKYVHRDEDGGWVFYEEDIQ